jgi:site-specific recombinase XerD
MTEDEFYNLHIEGQSTLMPALKAWEIYLIDQNRSPYTIKSFLGDLKLLNTFLPADKTIAEISTNDLNHFLEWIQNGRGRGIPCSPKSFSRRITTIKSFFRWLNYHGRIVNDPSNAILQHSVISPLPEVLTPAEEELVISSAEKMTLAEKPDHRAFILLELLLETGIKKSECINIHRNHIEVIPREPFLFIRYSNVKDRNKERKILLSQKWIDNLIFYYSEYQIEDILFPWSPRRLEYLLEDIGKASHLTKHLSFSMCRWTCALDDMRRGNESDRIRQKMGISKIQWREIKMKLEQLLIISGEVN